jgi:hypothetical protein
MSCLSKKSSWRVRYEVTFYGSDPLKGSFRVITEDIVLIGDDIPIKQKVPFSNKENAEINFLLWIDGLSVESLIELPHDYYSKEVSYAEESVEVLEVIKMDNE